MGEAAITVEDVEVVEEEAGIVLATEGNMVVKRNPRRRTSWILASTWIRESLSSSMVAERVCTESGKRRRHADG